MNLKIYKPLWGHQGTIFEAVDQAVEAGFDGLEGQVPNSAKEQVELRRRLDESGLSMVAEVFTGGWYVPSREALPHEHLADLRAGIERSLTIDPDFINTQTGLDAWPLSTQIGFFQGVQSLEREFGIDITVETHRSRSTFNPWVTREIANALPDLKLNLDFSHWCCVAERLVVSDDLDLLSRFADQCWHLHARIGYDQGPQVPDPRAPEFEREVIAHLGWWRIVWEQQLARGFETITMTPEFGPDGYLQQAPYTMEPVADLWEVNQWMASTLRDEFADWAATIEYPHPQPQVAAC